MKSLEADRCHCSQLGVHAKMAPNVHIACARHREGGQDIQLAAFPSVAALYFFNSAWDLRANPCARHVILPAMCQKRKADVKRILAQGYDLHTRGERQGIQLCDDGSLCLSIYACSCMLSSLHICHKYRFYWRNYNMPQPCPPSSRGKLSFGSV